MFCPECGKELEKAEAEDVHEADMTYKLFKCVHCHLLWDIMLGRSDNNLLCIDRMKPHDVQFPETERGEEQGDGII